MPAEYDQRRSSDHELRRKIEDLIEAEPDSRERTKLMITLQVAVVLTDTALAVRDMTTEFRKHREEFENHVIENKKLFDQGRALWRAVGIFAIVAQAAIGYFFTEHIGRVKTTEATVAEHSRALSVIAERHRIEEARAKTPPQP